MQLYQNSGKNRELPNRANTTTYQDKITRKPKGRFYSGQGQANEITGLTVRKQSSWLAL